MSLSPSVTLTNNSKVTLSLDARPSNNLIVGTIVSVAIICQIVLSRDERIGQGRSFLNYYLLLGV